MEIQLKEENVRAWVFGCMTKERVMERESRDFTKCGFSQLTKAWISTKLRESDQVNLCHIIEFSIRVIGQVS